MSRFADQFFIQITGLGPKEGPSEHPSIVFLHGVMGYAMNWRRVAKTFEDRYRVLAYDSRGHGRSVHADLLSNPDAYTPECLAEDLRGILDDLGWDQVILVGHSMGGRVAYTFAARYPDRVRGLVIEDIGPNMSPESASLSARVLQTVPVPFASKREAKEWFETQFPVLFSDLHDPLALGAWLYANITENSEGRAVWRFHAEGIRQAIVSGRNRERWQEIEQLSVPTLVVRGELSHDLPRDVFDRMLRSNKMIQGVEIAGAGHWVHSERHEPFVTAVREFTDSLL